MLNWRRLSLACFVLVALNACSPSQPTPPKKIENTSNPKVPFEGKLPKVDHIVIVVEENHGQEQIIGNSSAPYMNFLMSQGANLTNYHAIEHPSQPNYLDLFSGSNQNVTDDEVPKGKFLEENLASELIEKNLTFAGYSEDLPKVGFDGPYHENYARKHAPWTNFTNVPKDANQPLKNFPTDYSQLPTVSFVIPNVQNDMHDGSIKKADQWLEQHLDPYVQWAKENNSLLIVTWDEDDDEHNNKIPTFLVGPMVNTGEYNEKLNHFNLLRTLEELYGLNHAGKSESVEPITSIWKSS
ncbi:alkaline phosphatase family protein [Neobacillus dielmonensis]|uniref:alkaline phosphatase family protein n=1 Tax=Neobacillus dielmonensis TaxID=1347369 RepID=UPI000A5F6E07|nr:alkaline phosphatase family protein [Neobacillus dielmonensis]